MALVFPLLVLERSPGNFCHFVDDESYLAGCSLGAYQKFRQYPEVFFDRNGRKYGRSIQFNPVPSWWQRVAAFFHSPLLPVENTWHQTGNYRLEELKSSIVGCIQTDDDILTQFIEADHLILLIQQSRHFEDIYMVLQGAVYTCEDDKAL